MVMDATADKVSAPTPAAFPEVTTLRIEASGDGSYVAAGSVCFDDYFGGIGCFGNMEVDAYTDVLQHWSACAERTGARCWSALESGTDGVFRLVPGVLVDPFATAFVLVETFPGGAVTAEHAFARPGDPAAGGPFDPQHVSGSVPTFRLPA